jgi:hypothetical protein
MYPNYDRKKITSPNVATLAVVAIGIMALLASPYMLSTQEVFADGKNHDKKNGKGNEVPPAYIAIDGELSELQLETGVAPGDNGIADYEIDPQGTISFGERFSLLVPQAAGVLKQVDSAELTELSICVDDNCANDDFHISRELVDVIDDEFLYVETHVIDAPGEVGDGFTANEVGFTIYMWWVVFYTDGTNQTYVAIAHLEGDPCEEHGWVESGSGSNRCFDPEGD